MKDKTLFVVAVKNDGESALYERLVRAESKSAALAHVATVKRATADDVARIGSEQIEDAAS